MILSVALFNFLEALIIIVALIYVLVASIKLVMAKNIPGSKLIFGTIIFTFISATLSAAYPFFVEDENVFLEAAINFSLAIAFCVGALGFWRLSKFSISASANISLNRDAR